MFRKVESVEEIERLLKRVKYNWQKRLQLAPSPDRVLPLLSTKRHTRLPSSHLRRSREDSWSVLRNPERSCNFWMENKNCKFFRYFHEHMFISSVGHWKKSSKNGRQRGKRNVSFYFSEPSVPTTLWCLQVALRESISRGMNFDRYSGGAFFLQTSLIATYKKVYL